VAVKQFKQGYNYEDIDFSELEESDLRAVRDFLHELNLQMSGITGSGQSQVREEVYEELWDDLHMDELVTDTILEVNRVNASGHTVRDIQGSFNVYSDNSDHEVKFSYNTGSGLLELKSRFADVNEDYALEKGLSGREELVSEIGDCFDSKMIYENEII
jgi:hypothetical protein